MATTDSGRVNEVVALRHELHDVLPGRVARVDDQVLLVLKRHTSALNHTLAHGEETTYYLEQFPRIVVNRENVRDLVRVELLRVLRVAEVADVQPRNDLKINAPVLF